MEDQNSKIETQEQMALLRQDIDRGNHDTKLLCDHLSHDIEAFQKARGWKEDMVTFATVLTLGVLILYTWETNRLRVTAQLQYEYSMRPLVVLGSKDDTIASKHTIVIRNVGSGPALNAATMIGITIENAKLATITRLVKRKREKSAKETWEESGVDLPISNGAVVNFQHRRIIAVSETQDVNGVEQNTGKDIPEVTLAVDMNQAPWKRVTPVGNVAALMVGEKRKVVCIGYQNLLGQQYETWQLVTLIAQGNLGLDYICQRRTSTPCIDENKNAILTSLASGTPLENTCPK